MRKRRFLMAVMMFAAVSMVIVSCKKDNNEDFDPNVQTPANPYNGHDYVDLGLSVKWATCNVGASQPEQYGNYFAWGEVAPKYYYDMGSYKWWTIVWIEDENGGFWDVKSINKYNVNKEYGKVDDKTTLDLSDDAARINMGGIWRMPTVAEQQELINKCTWSWIRKSGVYGYNVTSKINGNSIFLPAAGFYADNELIDNEDLAGCYASSSLSDESTHFYVIGFGKSRYLTDQEESVFERSYGTSIRGVCK